MSALKLDVSNNIAILTFDTPNSRANTLGQAIRSKSSSPFCNRLKALK